MDLDQIIDPFAGYVCHVPAGLLSFVPRLVMNSHHWKDGKGSIDKGSIDSVTKKKANEPSRLSGGDSFHPLPSIYRGSLKKRQLHKSAKVKPCFVNKSVRFGRTELSLVWRNPYREIYNLGMFSRRVVKNKNEK